MNIWTYFRFGCYLHSSSSVFLPAPSLPAPSLPTPSLPTPSAPTHLVPTLYSNSQVHLLSSFVFHFSFNSPSPLTSLSPLVPPHLPPFLPLPPPGSLVVMSVTQETIYRRRVCVKTVIFCVNSVWDPDPATVPPVKTQGNDVL